MRGLNMRTWDHKILTTPSGKSINLTVKVIEPYGKRTFCMSTLRGWRAALVCKHFTLESKEWNTNVAKQFVTMEVLKSAKNRYEAHSFINIVKLLGSMEIHFWASKFLLERTRTRKAWRCLYL